MECKDIFKCLGRATKGAKEGLAFYALANWTKYKGVFTIFKKDRKNRVQR